MIVVTEMYVFKMSLHVSERLTIVIGSQNCSKMAFKYLLYSITVATADMFFPQSNINFHYQICFVFLIFEYIFEFRIFIDSPS